MLSNREGYVLVCESGSKIGQSKVTKLEIKSKTQEEDSQSLLASQYNMQPLGSALYLVHSAVYMHMKPIIDVCLDHL